MKIAICSPVELRLLAPFFQRSPTSLPVGTSSTIVTLLIAGLLARGHEITLFTLSGDVQSEVVLQGARVSAFVGPMRARHRARNLWADERLYLSRAIVQQQPDFVHAHWTYEYALAALGSGIPTLTTIHDLPWNVLRYFRDPYRAARLLIAYFVAARGQEYTAVSEDAKRHFRKYFRPGAQVTVVPNFLSDDIFAKGKLPSVSVHPLTYCTILQGWSARKNGWAAIVAFAQVRRKLPTARLLMIGTDYQLGGLAHTWAVQRGWAEGICFQGPLQYRDMLSTFYEQADVLVHPSLDESFSMAALEGMALRKPVIAGRHTPGVREVLEFGQSGTLVDVKRPKEIAAAMERLGRDPDLRTRTADAAYDSALRRFREGPVIEAYEALYKSLVQRHAPGVVRLVEAFPLQGSHPHPHSEDEL